MKLMSEHKNSITSLTCFKTISIDDPLCFERKSAANTQANMVPTSLFHCKTFLTAAQIVNTWHTFLCFFLNVMHLTSLYYT